jgi:outer membrane protein OmpA-like peptidoglycan-associated protein
VRFRQRTAADVCLSSQTLERTVRHLLMLTLKKLAKFLSLVGVTAVLASCSNSPSVKSAACSTESIGQATQPSELRGIVGECSSGSKAEHLAMALSKLNELPPAVSKRIQLRPPAPRAESEQVEFELDLYFNPLEAYLPASGIDKLDTFVERLNTTYSIRSVRLVGSVEQAEKALPSFQIARKRADFVRRYLLAAGMLNEVPVELIESNPKQPDTQEGRARDRSVAIKVVAYRRRAGRT